MAATSSTLNPPKKRSSTTRLFRTSVSASACNASSRRPRSDDSRGHDHRFVKRDRQRRAAALLTPSGPRVVHEDLAHQAGGQRVEVAAVVPVDRAWNPRGGDTPRQSSSVG